MNNRRSLISVWNLTDVLRIAADHPNAAGRTWLVSDGEDVSTPRLLQLIAKGMGRGLRLWPVPGILLKAGGYALGRYAEVTRLVESLQLDIGAAQRLLGFQPSVSLEEGIRRTAESYMRSRHAAT